MSYRLLHKYAVLQAGARMHYAVPSIFSSCNSLSALFTDFTSDVLPFKRVLESLPPFLIPPRLKRLLARRVPNNIPRKSVFQLPVTSIFMPQRKVERALLTNSLRLDFNKATAIYTNFINNDLSVLQLAKQRDIHIVHEVVIGPDVGLILHAEQQKYPLISGEGDPIEQVLHGLHLDRKKWNICDKILVPSQFTFDSCVFHGCDPSKISIVPYGLPAHWAIHTPEPITGRILFVGQVGLRKGSHYLAHACRLLRSRGLDFECRVAGPLLVDISHPLFSGPTYLGAVPRSQIHNEYHSADILVLPTLADSFGLVHLEAMSYGIPVITTPNCGSVVRDGVDGFIVPIRSPNLLADRIEELLINRSLRQSMSVSSLQRASQYTWSTYQQNLLSALSS